MSNSGGDDEDHLSTPTEESVEDDADKNQDDRHNVKMKDFDAKRIGKAMTGSNSSDRGDTADETKLPRRYAQLTDENVLLKKQLKKQEERIKILATKLIRVISERSNKTKREEILLEEQKARIADLEHEVSILRDKLQVTKQQLSSYTRLIPHHHPPSRQPSMLSSSSTATMSKSAKKGRRSTSESQQGRPSTGTSSGNNLLVDKNFADRVEELLLEAKAENQALEDQLKNCRQRLSSTEETLEKVKETLKNKESEHKEELLALKSELDKEEDLVNKKKQLSDNIQLIRLQREARRTASWLSTLEAQNKSLEGNLATAMENVQQLESQVSETQGELAEEQQKNISLQKQMEDATSSLSRLKELEAQIKALQEENKILQEANESLLKNAFSVKEKAEKAESVEKSMKQQMAHLESALKAEMRSKSDISESLRVEKDRYVRLEVTNEKLQRLLDKLDEDMRRRGEMCCGNTNTNQTLTNTSQQSVVESLSCCAETSKSYGKLVDTCPTQKKVAELEKELNSLKESLGRERSEREKTAQLLINQTAETEKYQKRIEEITEQTKAAEDFQCEKLRELVKGLEERKTQITELEKRMEEWRRQQSSTCISCQVGESRTVLRKKSSEEIVTESYGENNVEVAVPSVKTTEKDDTSEELIDNSPEPDTNPQD